MVSAFIAGIAALFAPCCITVLLPSYLGSIFRERSKVFLMTFIFFLGILVVFLPLGLGSAVFGQLLSRYHTFIFAVGGTVLLLLGLSLIFGIHFSLPFHVNPTLKKHNAFSVFTLGIFSGIATTCCAPVLAGVLALSALPGSIFWGGMYTLSYVLGMVFPLFFIALFLDKTQVTKKFMEARKPLAYSLGSRKIHLTWAEAVSGLVFSAMGIFTLVLAATNRLGVHSEYQVNMNIFLTKLLNAIKGFTALFPEWAWAAFFLLLVIIITIKSINLFKEKNTMGQSNKQNNITTWVLIGVIIILVLALNNAYGKKGAESSAQKVSSGADDMASHHSGGATNLASVTKLDELIGKPSPNFSLTDLKGNEYSLEKLKGKNVVLFFNEGTMCYPACWNQIVALARDSRLKGENMSVLSVVVDPPQAWENAIKKMPELGEATVVFDKGGVASNAFGMLKTPSSMHFGQLPGHTYVIIDKEGIIRHVYDDPRMAIHNDGLADELSRLQ